jgi:glucosamine--fructose-6-phosphate aminotransferase (isomerizing)
MATENRTHSRSIDLVKAAANLGSTVVLLTYEGDREIDSVGNIGIELPMVDEQLAPFLSIIPLYLFAYYTAVKRGHNPDYLRYLTPTYWDARTIIFPAGTH